MKKIFMIIGAVFITGLIAFGVNVYMSITNATEEILNEDIQAINFNQYEDGIYEGEYYHDDIGITVSLEINQGTLVSIEYSNHKNGKGEKAETIKENIIEEQSILVDDISGATISSRCIKLALINAMEGENNE